MKIEYIFKSSLSALAANKSRSLLTILGIVIGIMAIIIVMSLGEGAQNLILSQIQSIGSRVIAIVPGREPTGPTDFTSLFADSLKDRDLISLQNKNNVPHASIVMGIVFGSAAVTHENNTYTPTIFGSGAEFADIYNITPSEGRIFTQEEAKGFVDVAVIGSKVQEKLFDNESALGQTIRIKNTTFRVIGILKSTGQLSFLNFDDAVFVPYSTAQQYIMGIKYFNRMVVEADSDANVAGTVEDIKATLRADHNITDPAKDDFFVQTQESALQTVSTILNVLTLFLAAVAAISLVVGGIGIMNIMLVSVTERTREIGLRKALGATDRDILTQFLLEAIILTVIGGVIGITLGGLFSFLISFILSHAFQLNWAFALPLTAVLLGIGVASAIGLVFGIYPARQAARKSPIEALRYE